MSWGKLKEGLMEKAQKITEKVNKLVEHGIDLANDESPMHLEAKKFYKQISQSFKTNKEQLSSELIDSLEIFLIEFNAILENDSDSPYSRFPEQQCHLVDNCVKLLQRNQKSLQVNAEWWQQIKTSLYAYLEKSAAIADTLAAEISTAEYKAQLNDLRNQFDKDEIVSI